MTVLPKTSSKVLLCSAQSSGWLEVITHPERPATGHFDTGFLALLSFKQMLRCFPSPYFVLLMLLSQLKLSKLSFVAVKDN
jgi:hypothetical protein